MTAATTAAKTATRTTTTKEGEKRKISGRTQSLTETLRTNFSMTPNDVCGHRLLSLTGRFPSPVFRVAQTEGDQTVRPAIFGRWTDVGHWSPKSHVRLCNPIGYGRTPFQPSRLINKTTLRVDPFVSLVKMSTIPKVGEREDCLCR